jgi:trigger factor
MNVTTTNAPNSSVRLDVELPPEDLSRAIDEAVRRLGKRTRIPGFRPGKAPRGVLEAVLGPTAVLDEAVEQLVERAYRKALVESEVVPLAEAKVEVVQAEEGKPLLFNAIVPVRPEVVLGDYRSFTFQPEIEAIDDAKVDSVIDELRDQYASLSAVEDRPAAKGDYAVISYVGTRDGEPFEGGSSDRMPLILGEERLIPGFEDQILGMAVDGTKGFDITFPEDYPDTTLAGREAHFEIALKELREKVQPELDDDFAASLGSYASVDELRTEVRARLERNALDRARHTFADRIVEYAVANATLELPDVLVDQEVEVMHDEFRSALARQGLTYDAYVAAVASGETTDDPTASDGKRPATPEDVDRRLHAEWRPRAEARVKTLMVITRIAEAEGLKVPDADVEAEVERARERYASDRKLVGYFESERGRDFIRSTLRRSRMVEQLVDDWLAAHPEHPPLPHAEDDDEASPVDAEAVQASASIGATDPGSVMVTDDDHSDHAAQDAGNATEPAASR